MISSSGLSGAGTISRTADSTRRRRWRSRARLVIVRKSQRLKPSSTDGGFCAAQSRSKASWTRSSAAERFSVNIRAYRKARRSKRPIIGSNQLRSAVSSAMELSQLVTTRDAPSRYFALPPTPARGREINLHAAQGPWDRHGRRRELQALLRGHDAPRSADVARLRRYPTGDLEGIWRIRRRRWGRDRGRRYGGRRPGRATRSSGILAAAEEHHPTDGRHD